MPMAIGQGWIDFRGRLYLVNINRFRRRAGLITKLLGAGILSTTPGYAQVDMEVMMQWMDATVIHWSVVGDYEGDALILEGGSSGFAPVKDHVEIGFDYTSEGNGGLVGTPSVTESVTQMGALRSGSRWLSSANNLRHL